MKVGIWCEDLLMVIGDFYFQFPLYHLGKPSFPVVQEHLPLFTEVMDWAVANDIALDIEVKHPHPGDEVALAQTVLASGLRDPWVMSFDGDFMDRFEKEAPEIKTGVLIHERPLFDKAKPVLY